MSKDSNYGCVIFIGLIFVVVFGKEVVGLLQVCISILSILLCCVTPFIILGWGGRGFLKRKKYQRIEEVKIQAQQRLEDERQAYLTSPQGMIDTEIKELKKQNKRLLKKLKELVTDIGDIDKCLHDMEALDPEVEQKIAQTIKMLKGKRNGFQQIVTANKKRIKFLKKKENELLLLAKIEAINQKYKVNDLSDELDEHLYLKVKSALNVDQNYTDFTCEIIAKIEMTDDSQELEKILKLIEETTDNTKVG